MCQTQTLTVMGFVVVVFDAALSAQVTVSIDMYPTTTHVDDTLVVDPAQLPTVVEVAIVMDVPAAGLRAYGVSVQYDSTELTVVDANFVEERLPSGFDNNITVGVQGVNNAVQPGIGQVSTFEAVSLPSNGPAGVRLVVGRIQMRVEQAIDDQDGNGMRIPDVWPGLFNQGLDPRKRSA